MKLELKNIAIVLGTAAFVFSGAVFGQDSKDAIGKGFSKLHVDSTGLSGYKITVNATGKTGSGNATVNVSGGTGNAQISEPIKTLNIEVKKSGSLLNAEQDFKKQLVVECKDTDAQCQDAIKRQFSDLKSDLASKGLENIDIAAEQKGDTLEISVKKSH